MPFFHLLIDSYEAFEEFLAAHIQNGKLAFDGVFCVTDSLAYFIIKVLRRLGQRVPEDVQVIGFDGIRQLGVQDYVCSTIVQPVAEIAEMCVELLLQESLQVKPPLVCLPVAYAYGGTTAEGSERR
nr:substrate-binding domain-containing protein [uncultured Acetatifactor sp.]